MRERAGERDLPRGAAASGHETVRVTVPASTANLGSGFDSLGMALSLYDTVEIDVVDGPPGQARVAVDGEGAGKVPSDDRHLLVRVLHRTLDELGAACPALEIRCRNVIPHSRGLGSSAATIVAGTAAGYALAGADLAERSSAEHALQLAAEVEGHADNAAASLYGGAVIAWNSAGRFRAVRLEPHSDVVAVALVPGTESATHTTRGLLPAHVPHADATFAAGRAALAVHALTTEPSLLFDATDDRLHQDYREPAWPATVSVLRRLRAEGVPAAVSGAGPTVLALPQDGVLPSGFDVADFDVLRLPVDLSGVRVEYVPAALP